MVCWERLGYFSKCVLNGGPSGDFTFLGRLSVFLECLICCAGLWFRGFL